MEKRNIQISLEEAKEWYNSSDSFKRELALKAYKEEELTIISYSEILKTIEMYNKNLIYIKSQVYERLLIVATYLNSIYKEEYHNGIRMYFYIKPKVEVRFPGEFDYQSFRITSTIIKGNYIGRFNSLKAAKKAIDILGEELNVLFE